MQQVLLYIPKSDIQLPAVSEIEVQDSAPLDFTGFSGRIGSADDLPNGFLTVFAAASVLFIQPVDIVVKRVEIDLR